MISISHHINKLQALNKYMEVWIAAQHAMRVYLEWRARPFYKFDEPHRGCPSILPDFETWYEMHLVANN
jgi:hypothetical protein